MIGLPAVRGFGRFPGVAPGGRLANGRLKDSAVWQVSAGRYRNGLRSRAPGGKLENARLSGWAPFRAFALNSGLWHMVGERELIHLVSAGRRWFVHSMDTKPIDRGNDKLRQIECENLSL